MDRIQLLQHFDTLAETPEAVAKLRGFVRDLAVRGCLVPQNNKDEPSSELLKRIIDEKRKLTREGVGKDKLILEPIPSDACPFVIPKNWSWVRTQDVTTYVQRGKSPKYSFEKTIPVIAQKCIQWHGFELHKAQFIEPESLESYSEDRFVQDGDLLWNSTGLGTLGRIIVFKERYKDVYPQIVADSHVTVIRPSKFVVPDYLFCWFAGPKVQNEINAKASGSTKQTELATSTVLSYAIPLPPLAEQKRIVAKVEELLALCDELEARQTAAREHHTRLVRSALDHLTAAKDESDFKKRSAFCLQNSELLFDSVPALRQAIVALALKGQLTHQDPQDESASELIRRIDNWRKDAINSKSIRAPKRPLDAIESSEMSHKLPAGWEWTRLGVIIYVHSGDGLTADAMIPDGIPVFGGNGINGFHNSANVQKETIVIGRVGFYCGSIHVTPAKAWVTDNAFITEFCTDALSKDFLTLLLRGTDLKKREDATAQPVISGGKIYPIVVALPPLAEQKRIVAKVDELMRWCDALEARLTAAQTAGEHLLDASLRQILAA